MSNQRAGTIRVRLTAELVNGATCPEGKSRQYIFDDKVGGLALAVTSRGGKAFYIYKWSGGRPVKKRLGKWPAMKVEQARTEAVKQSAKLGEGVDINADRRTRAQAPTLAELFETFKGKVSRRTKKPKSAKTIEDYNKQWRLYLEPWANRRITDITGDEVVKLHASIAKPVLGDDGKPLKDELGNAVIRGRYQANRVVALLSAMYSVAPANIQVANPAKAVDRFRESHNLRWLRTDEVKPFMSALAKEPCAELRDAILMALLTGARRGNVQAMRWADVDMKSATWHIPTVKGGEPLDVAIPAPAMEILKARAEACAPGCPWVFPSKRSASGHIEELKTALARAVKAAGIPKLRVHDLRHTCASWIVNHGGKLESVQRQLGHKSLATTLKYAHTDLGLARSGVGAAAEAMFKATK